MVLDFTSDQVPEVPEESKAVSSKYLGSKKSSSPMATNNFTNQFGGKGVT